MNRIPARITERRKIRGITLSIIALALATVPGTWAKQAARGASASTYDVEFIVTPVPEAGGAKVEMRLRQDDALLREVNMRAPAEYISEAGGDGEVRHQDERIVWRPPASGGSLHWFAKIGHLRNGTSYDAYIESDWAIFRAEDVIPQAATRTQSGARSRTSLRFDLPRGWSSVTQYFGRSHRYEIEVPERRFDRPAGWILLGKIGVRRDDIADVSVTVAAPVGQGMRRMDIMSLLSWALPDIVRVFPDFPARITIIGANDPMWRGGLSGPASLFIHSDRPLLSENSTSTLLHELIHVALGRGAASGSDWIVEGLAEFYSLEILRRSGTITAERFRDTMQSLSEWARDSDTLCGKRSSGPTTARAVAVFAALDQELRTANEDAGGLDDVIRALAQSDAKITIDSLVQIATKILGTAPDSLSPEKLPGCDL